MHRIRAKLVASAIAAALAAAGCDIGNTTPSSDSAVARAATAAGSAQAGFDPARWQPPDTAAITRDSLGSAVRRGLALVLHTTDSLPRYAPGHVTCSNCHLDAGRNVNAAPLTGSHARFPKFMERTGAVIPLADRVNYCFTRSLAGTRLPVDSREMQDILAYLAWLSQGVPVGTKLPGADGLQPMPALVGDEGRGGAVFAAKCQVCHGADGQGGPAIPALWGPRSFSVGASMARQSKAASFIWHNMPLGQGKSLTPQEAFDVATYVAAKPRPDSPGKELDWPAGGTPADVPYATRGHAAFRPPPVLARADRGGAVVSPPASVSRRAGAASTRGGPR